MATYDGVMCGIVGIVTKDSSVALGKVVQHMRDTISYRGPDDAGLYAGTGIALGHRRLSILDLTSAGHQPMSTPDGRFTIVFNGEIYNYEQLRRQYIAGVPLHSSSDTEVLLHLLAQQGMNILPKLKGMFAFALWDNLKQTLHLARDPFGKKPLYYYAVPGLFIFASEIKAILAYPGLNRELDTAALPKYFLYEYIPSPASPYKNIRQLAGGQRLILAGDQTTISQWWQPQFTPKQNISATAATRQFDHLLQQAVARRLISDVPVGVLLSGGLDSTAIAWYMRQLRAPAFHSFSISFRETSFNESRYAQQAAQALRTEHHDISFDIPQFFQALAHLVPLLDTPLADASLLPTYVVSQQARRYVTVVLDGDGSDELLGGYGTFTAARAAAFAAPLAPLLQYAAKMLPTRYGDFTFDFKVKSFVKGLEYTREKRNQIWLGSFSDHELTHLLLVSPQTYKNLWEEMNALQPQLTALSNFDAISALTIRQYLHDDILVKLDRASMYASLEARTPFLDVDLAEFVMRLPVGLKRNKKLLKTIMHGRIPAAIINRPKKGFGIPLGYWLRGPLYSWACQVLEADKLRQDGYLNPVVAERLLREHRSGKADHRKKIWTLLSWQLWYDHWIAKRDFPHSPELL